MCVQIRNGQLFAAGLVCAQLLLFVPATQARVSDPMLSYILHFFSDVDGVNVYSQYGSTGIRMTDDLNVKIQWGHDVVVFPAIEAPPGTQEAADAITSASRPIAGTAAPYQDFVKVRDEVQGFATYQNLRATYYVSTESDYFAQMVAVHYSQNLMSDNLNITTGISYGWDKIEPLADDDTAGLQDFRRTLYFNLVGTQVLSPTTVVRLGWEYNAVQGLQHDPYRNVYVAGTNIPELHPAHRDRWDVFLRVNQYITNRSSLRLDYRYYTDDWNIDSHTIGGKLSQYVTDEFIIRYRYRYYTQTPAYFFRSDYIQPGGIGGFRTNDYRLGNYGAHLFGGQLAWQPHRIVGKVSFLRGAQFTLGYEHYFNGNNFSANVYETGLQFNF